jgi:hypothetical protein
MQLSLLDLYVMQFNQALALLAMVSDVAKAAPKVEDRPERENIESTAAVWGLMAVESAVLIVYHFRAAARSVRASVGLVPAIKDGIDFEALTSAVEAIDASFPDLDAVRHGVCHKSDQHFTPAHIAKQMADTGEVVHGCYHDHKYQFTVEGRRVALEVSPDTLALLKRLLDGMYEVFWPVSVFPKRLGPDTRLGPWPPLPC